MISLGWARPPIIIAVLLSAILVLLLSWREEPRGFFHPDALIFTHLTQAALGKATSWSDLPGVVVEALRDCSRCDWNRGRITGYLLFLLGGVVRPHLGTGFLDPAALVLMSFNAWLAALVFQKLSFRRQPATEAFLAALLIFSPFCLVAVQVQFIYAKYLCTTFMLAALLVASFPAKITWLAAGVLSDEIGLLFGMIYGGVLLAERLPSIPGGAVLRSAARLGVAGGWAGFLWFLYHLFLQVFFGRLPTLMKKSKLLPGWEQVGDTLFYPIKTVLWGWGLLCLELSKTGDGASGAAGFPWPAWVAPVLMLGVALAFLLSRPHPVAAIPRDALRDFVCMMVTLGAVNFVFYKGQVGDYGCYGYPLFVGLTLAVLLVLNFFRPATAVAVSALLTLTALLAVPATQNGIRQRIGQELLSGVIPLQEVADLERLVLKTGQQGALPASFLSGQDLAITPDNRFTAKYFPVKGIARNFLWPRPLPGQPPALRIEP